MSWLIRSGGQSIGESFSFSSPSDEYSELIPFGIPWFALLAVLTPWWDNSECVFHTLSLS